MSLPDYHGTNVSAADLALEDIRERLHEAIQAIAAQPDRERGWLRVKSGMPDTLRDPLEVWVNALENEGKHEAMRARRPQPSPEALDRMLPTLQWLRWVEPRDVRIIAARSFGVPWLKIAARVGRSERTVQIWERRALETIWQRLVSGG